MREMSKSAVAVAHQAPAVGEAARNACFARVLADNAYEAEYNHAPCRREPGVRTTALPINPSAHPGRVPGTKYRRLMRTQFPRRLYGQRSQAGSVFSRHKRHLGPASTARREDRQRDVIRMRVLTHNLMLLAGASS